MEPTEIQARATIAAALILTRAVEYRPFRQVATGRGILPLFGCAISLTTSAR